MDILPGAAQFVMVTVIAFGILVLIASSLRFHWMTRAVREPDSEEERQADALAVEIAHRLGSVHRVPEPFCLLLLGLVPAPGSEMPAHAGTLLDQLEGVLKMLVRADDVVLRHGSSDIGLLLPLARNMGEAVGGRLLERLRRRLGPSAPGWAADLTVGAGLSSHPENGTRTQELIQAAQSALERARQDPESALAFAAAAVPTPPVETAPRPAPGGWLDVLTGVLREDRLPIALQRKLSRHRKEHHPLALVLADVDHLEQYNEHYGREAGDILLKGVADFLQHHVRETDLIGRLEQDSFEIIMDCTAPQAIHAARRLIHELRKVSFAFPGGSLRATVSIGVAGYPDHAAYPRDLMRAVRYALRAAKRRGGSRAMIFEPAMQTVAEEAPREVDAL